MLVFFFLSHTLVSFTCTLVRVYFSVTIVVRNWIKENVSLKRVWRRDALVLDAAASVLSQVCVIIIMRSRARRTHIHSLAAPVHAGVADVSEPD